MDDLGLDSIASNNLATAISLEIDNLSQSQMEEVKNTFTPIPIELVFEEINAFQQWMDLSTKIKGPLVTRAQVIVQNYICFLYLGDACFRRLSQLMPDGSITETTSKYLVSGPIRAFRNAIAHGKWHYSNDFSHLIYWDWDDPTHKNNVRWEVSQVDLDFLAKTFSLCCLCFLSNDNYVSIACLSGFEDAPFILTCDAELIKILPILGNNNEDGFLALDGYLRVPTRLRMANAFG